ncbi:ABC transporter permease [Lentzea sp. NPDC051838]|uniref:ABC transporter permease n=1 Tax=Lentzea sp. NPDC051838 TaxID=3154849 RepID=UPI003449205B
MGSLRDTAYLSARALTARKGRTLLAMLGPALGVAAIVGAITYSQSASAEVQETLRSVGSDLVVVAAAEGAPGSSTTLPLEAAERARNVRTVLSAAPLSRVPGVLVGANELGAGTQATAAYGVQSTSSALVDVADLQLAQGRFLLPVDEERGARVAVIGAEVAATIGYDASQPQTIRLGAEVFGVVGAIRPTTLASELNTSVLIPVSTSVTLFGADSKPSQLLLEVEPGTTEKTVPLLDVAVTYGDGPPPEVRVPAELLAAGMKIDQTLQWVVAGMGGLALLVGGLGIANVLTMSVLERSAEIGVRRALGHRRFHVALQFLGEAWLIGVIGGLVGVAAAVAGVGVVVSGRGWPVAVDPLLVVAALGVAVAITMTAAVYPAVTASRLDPMRVLRLG